jgi:hypothetical protein
MVRACAYGTVANVEKRMLRDHSLRTLGASVSRHRIVMEPEHSEPCWRGPAQLLLADRTCLSVPKEGRMVHHGNEISSPSHAGGTGLLVR